MHKSSFKILVITPVSHIDGFNSIINKLGLVDYHENISKSKIYKIINKYDVVFTNPNKSNVYFDKNLINKATNLKILCTASTGTNHIDKLHLKKKGIKLVSLTKNKKIINQISSTAEHALALSLSSIRKIPFSFDGIRKNNEWNYEKYIGRQFNYLNVGIIGAGRLGKMYLNLAKNIFGKILVYDPYVKIKETKKIKQSRNIKNLFKKCDLISLHIHADDITDKLINKDLLNHAKNNLILVNTSRGEVVNEKDLIYFLKKNKGAIYATDVLTSEIKNKKRNIIIKYSKIYKNQIIITQHIGGMTIEGQKIAYLGALDDLKNKINNYS